MKNYLLLSFVAGLALVTLVSYTYLQNTRTQVPQTTENAFITRANSALSPIVGAEAIPVIPKGLTVSVGQGVVKRDYSEFEYSAFKQVEKRAFRAGDEVYYKIIVNSRPEEYLKWFTADELASYGYASNSAFKTRRFAQTDAPACKFERISLSDAVEFCVWNECSAPVCSHSFAECGGMHLDVLIESTAEQRSNAYALEQEFLKAFSEVC
jgi:hypothetical protein